MPESVVAARVAVVAAEDDEGVVADTELRQPVEDPPDVEVERRYRREVPLQRLAVAHVVGSPLHRPRVQRLLRAGPEGTLVVGVDDLLGVPGERGVRGVVVDAEAERPLPVGADELQRVVGDRVGEVAGLCFDLPVPDHAGVVVLAAAGRHGEPVAEAVLRRQAVAEVPLAAEPDGVAVAGQDVGVAGQSLEVAGRDPAACCPRGSSRAPRAPRGFARSSGSPAPGSRPGSCRRSCRSECLRRPAGRERGYVSRRCRSSRRPTAPGRPVRMKTTFGFFSIPGKDSPVNLRPARQFSDLPKLSANRKKSPKSTVPLPSRS